VSAEQTEALYARELLFHDAWALSTRSDSVKITAAFEAITATENRFILTLLGDLEGKRLLDVGSGLGEASVYFALQGAEVTAMDLAPEMVAMTQRNAQAHGTSVRGLVSPAEELSEHVQPESFDIVYAANTIHHVSDRRMFLQSVHRALKPGGIFVSWDPLAYNPVINVYRMMATKVRTEDEVPLTFDDLALAKEWFAQVHHREFWLTTQLLFLKYFFIDRYDLNQIRYWKRILEETPETIGWWYTPLRRLDDWLLSLPLVRRLAWNTVIWCRKASAPLDESQA
jgi:SAM-dependent methyltransferase